LRCKRSDKNGLFDSDEIRKGKFIYVLEEALPKFRTSEAEKKINTFLSSVSEFYRVSMDDIGIEQVKKIIKAFDTLREELHLA